MSPVNSISDSSPSGRTCRCRCSSRSSTARVRFWAPGRSAARTIRFRCHRSFQSASRLDPLSRVISPSNPSPDAIGRADQLSIMGRSRAVRPGNARHGRPARCSRRGRVAGRKPRAPGRGCNEWSGHGDGVARCLDRARDRSGLLQCSRGVARDPHGRALRRTAVPGRPRISQQSTKPPNCRPSHSAMGSLATTEPKSESEVRPPVSAAPSREPAALVVVDSPGGFPLLGTAAVGYWRTRVADPDADSGTPPLGDWNSDASNPLEKPGTGHSSMPLATEEGAARTEQSDRAAGPCAVSPVPSLRAWDWPPSLTLNALLSQPIAGFDYLASRLYRSGFAAFSLRRKRDP